MTYADKTYGVSFDYPRKYAIETGNAANELVGTNPLPMNFVQAGGTALAAVELPGDVLPLDGFLLRILQCERQQVAHCRSMRSILRTAIQAHRAIAASSKLMIGDMELYGTEAVAGDGPRQSDSKYFHIFQNGACYEFALNVTTNASEIEAGMKHVDRDKVFDRLAKILATVKINPVVAPEVNASTPETQPATPAPKPPQPSNTTASTPPTPATPPAPATPGGPGNVPPVSPSRVPHPNAAPFAASGWGF